MTSDRRPPAPTRSPAASASTRRCSTRRPRPVPVSLRATSAGFTRAERHRAVALLRPRLPPARGRARVGPRLADGVPRGADPRGRRLGALRDRRLVAHRRPHRPGHDLGVPQLVPPPRHPAAHPLRAHRRASAARTTGSPGTSTAPSREIPSAWDFPQVDEATFCLPEAQVGTWGGFVFVNVDPDGATAPRTTSRICPRTSPSGRSRSATSPPTSSGRCRATGRWRSKPSSRRTTRWPSTRSC